MIHRKPMAVTIANRFLVVSHSGMNLYSLFDKGIGSFHSVTIPNE